MRRMEREFAEKAERVALDISEYGTSRGYDIWEIGAAAKLIFEAVKDIAVKEMLKDPKATLDALCELIEDEYAEDVIKEAEGVLRNGSEQR